MIDGADPVHVRQRTPLRIADRDQRQIAIGGVDWLECLYVEPSMHRGYGWRRRPPRHWKRPAIQMRVDHIEVVRVVKHLTEHWQMQRRSGVIHRAVQARETKRLRATR